MSEQFATPQFHPLSIVIPVWGSPIMSRQSEEPTDLVPKTHTSSTLTAATRMARCDHQEGDHEAEELALPVPESEHGFTGNCNCGISMPCGK
jgi:hypothetical protein